YTFDAFAQQHANCSTGRYDIFCSCPCSEANALARYAFRDSPTHPTLGCLTPNNMTIGQKLKAFWNHPAGPKTIHFWAPTFKWGISLANIADINRPADKISLPQQCAITATGVIWSRYSTQITPVNYNLLAVNAFMALTGGYQLFRKISYDMAQQTPAATA
ncbi:hypothetical protein Agub_g7090, partial [Astrephomene gubernaculifera]